ncbi:MAG: hypothetical protein AAF797_03855 [Planctomycetota bacterium]
MKQFVCMKWGDRYPADYVNRLYSMIARHTTAPFRVVCLTDDPAGVRDEVECFDCPTINVKSKQQNGGWRKLSLWAPEVPGLTGTALFLDLDVVIVDSLDPFFEVDGDYCVMRNWTQSDKRIGNTSVFRFTVGSHPYLLEQLEADPPAIFAQYNNSQSFISDRVSNMTFFPDPWCLLFKVHCLPSMPARLFKAPHLPGGARVVAFPGHPDPHEAAAGQWPGPWHKRLYKTVRPTPWIKEHWR